MRLLLLSRGGSSRLFNHGDGIICIRCFKWLEITIPFPKCVSGKEQWPCENSLPPGLQTTTLRLIVGSRRAPQTILVHHNKVLLGLRSRFFALLWNGLSLVSPYCVYIGPATTVLIMMIMPFL